MKKIIVILTIFALSSLWGQKEIPTSVGDGEKVIDERVSANQSKSINPKIIQQIRAFKATKEKMHIKKEMINGTPSGSKSFKASNSESKFLAIKEVIELIKSGNSKKKISITKRQQNSNKSNLSSYSEVYISKESKSNGANK